MMSIVKFIISNFFKCIFAFCALSVALYFSLWLGPLLGATIGVVFVLIFGDGPYLEFLLWIVTICVFGFMAYELISEIWSDEIKAYKEKKEQQKEYEIRGMFKGVVKEMKQTAKEKGIQDDKKVQKIISDMEEFTKDNNSEKI